MAGCAQTMDIDDCPKGRILTARPTNGNAFDSACRRPRSSREHLDKICPAESCGKPLQGSLPSVEQRIERGSNLFFRT